MPRGWIWPWDCQFTTLVPGPNKSVACSVKEVQTHLITFPLNSESPLRREKITFSIAAKKAV